VNEEALAHWGAVVPKINKINKSLVHTAVFNK
jgi:hypothetical protein